MGIRQQEILSVLNNPLARVQQQTGFIPVDVRPKPNGHDVVWMDVGEYAFTKAKFEHSIRQLATASTLVETLTTDIELLANQDFLSDVLYPSGFIFHMSRCGSTLFAKALARTPQHIVIDEGTPLNDGLWHYLTGGWQKPIAYTEQAKTIYRNLVLALGRRRTNEQQAYFVKFRSWNAVFMDFITQIFPDVPVLFIYRDPVEVLVSGQWNRVWTLDLKGLEPGAYMTGCPLPATQAMDDLTFLAKFYARYFSTALQAKTNRLTYLNYEQLTQANFPKILKHAFGYQASAEQLAFMETQFGYYSKDDEDVVHFTSDKQAKQQAATQAMRQLVDQEMLGLYQQLDRSERNLAKWLK
ncbi:sulfotransferase family protein [soil metagenome]